MRVPSGRLLTALITGLVLLLVGSVGSMLLPALAQKADPGRSPHDNAAAQEAEQTLKTIMERRHAVQGVTARGQSIMDAPPFETTKRIEELYYYPCNDCHEDQVADPRVRQLKDEHTDLVFEHGGGRFWCYDACHNRDNMNMLRTFRGKAVTFDQSYLVCGQCHFQRQKDWYFGGHGKRAGMFALPRDAPKEHGDYDMSDRESIGTWQGKRVIHICTDCHDAHSPSIKPYEPSPPPQVRTGLTRRTDHEPVYLKVWEALGGGHGGEESK